MSDLNNKYKNIINEIEEKIKNPEELEFVKGKFTELSVFFIDIIDKLTSMTDARLSEIEENQREIDNRILKVQNIVNNIEDKQEYNKIKTIINSILLTMKNETNK